MHGEVSGKLSLVKLSFCLSFKHKVFFHPPIGECVIWGEKNDKKLQLFYIWHAKACTQKKCTSIDIVKLEYDM